MFQKPKKKDPSGVARALAETPVSLAAAVFSLVPLFVNPYNPVGSRFVLPKFELLLILSGLLLTATLAASLSGARFIRVSILLPAVIFFAISALSAGFSGNPHLSLVGTESRYNGLLSLAAGVLLFYAAARFLDSWGKVRFFLIAGATSATIVAAYGIAQRLGFDPLSHLAVGWIEPRGRVFSTLGNPILLAAYLTLMMGAAAALYWQAGSRGERVLWLSSLAVMGACWSYTYTRGAILGAGVALPIVIWLAYRRMGTIRPMLAPLAAIASSVLVATALTTGPMNFGPDPHKKPREAKSSAPKPAVESSRKAKSLTPAPLPEHRSVSVRLLIWRDTIPMILERPLLGHGPENFRGPFHHHEGEGLKTMTNYRPVDEAHNEFLQVAATTGLLGLAAYVWVLAAYFRKAYEGGGWTLIALSGGVLAYIVQLQTAFTTIATSVTFWALVGVSVAMTRLPDSCERKNGQSVE